MTLADFIIPLIILTVIIAIGALAVVYLLKLAEELTANRKEKPK